MHDIILVNKLSSKKMFTRLFPHIKEYAVSKETWKVLKTLSNYFRAYPHADEVVWPDFITFFMTVSKLKPDEHALYTSYFAKVMEDEGKEGVSTDDVLKNYITKDFATQIMNKAANIIHDKEGESLDDVASILSTFHKEVGSSVTKEDLFVPTTLSSTMKSCSEVGYSWRLEELNISAGPIRDGDFIVIAARPETGKTTFVASEISNFAMQMASDDRPIIWVNNEERGDKVMNRIIQSYFGTTISDMLANQEKYNDEYASKIGDRVLIINDDMNIRDVNKLSALFDEENPCMIVFDQLDKVGGFNKEARDDLRLGRLYSWARDLAKRFGPTIAVSQASESADFVNYIPLSMLRGSKTDKAGEADLIITIGKDKEDEYKRYINICKNKLWGGPRTQEVLRHGKFEVHIKPEIARYSGVY